MRVKTTENKTANAPSIPPSTNNHSLHRLRDLSFFVNGHCLNHHQDHPKSTLAYSKTTKDKQGTYQAENKIEERFSNLFCNSTIRQRLRRLLAEQQQGGRPTITQLQQAPKQVSSEKQAEIKPSKEHTQEQQRTEIAHRYLRVKSIKMPQQYSGQTSFKLRATHSKFSQSRQPHKNITDRSTRPERIKTDHGGEPCIMINPFTTRNGRRPVELAPHLSRERRIHMQFNKFRKSSYAAVTNPHALPPPIRLSTKKSVSSAICLTH